MTYKYFTEQEFVCQETGENEIVPEFIHRLDELRELCGFPFTITSGYRSPQHSIEAAKAAPGKHSEGIAADVRVVDGVQRRTIIEKALTLGFGGIGVAKSFVHVDIRVSTPVVWTY